MRLKKLRGCIVRMTEWGRIGHNEYTCAKCKKPILNYRERVRIEVSVYSSTKTASVGCWKDFHLGCTAVDRFNYQQVGM